MNKNYQQRLNWLELQSTKFIEDLSKANDFILLKSSLLTVFIFAYCIASLFFFGVLLPLVAMLITIIGLLILCRTSQVQSSGFSASEIKLKEADGYVDIDETSYLVHAENDDKDVYAYIFKELQKKETNLLKINKKLAIKYKAFEIIIAISFLISTYPAIQYLQTLTF